MNMRLLEILEKNSRVSLEDMAAMLSLSIEEVAKEIDELEKKQVITGYSALVDWSKTEREFVSAMIEVKVTLQRDQGFEKIAEKIKYFDEVQAIYLMSGGYDFLVLLEGKNLNDIAFFVANKLSNIDSVLSTSTHFVLKKYKDNGFVFGKRNDEDERMIISI